MSSPSSKKITIYVDIDDEITAIIDKLLATEQKIVAMVLPKRAVVLQSSVNMRLLKKAAESANKNIVLITTETPLLPLAGAAGIHVASSLSSKPSIPKVPKANDDTIDAGELADEELSIDKSATVGTLAGTDHADAETIEIDNTEPDIIPDTKEKPKKNKKLKVPNFNSFRLRLLLGGVIAVVLIVGWYLLFVVLPKAEVIVRTDTKATAAQVAFTTSAKATTLDKEKSIIPSKQSEVKKTNTEKAPATGEKDLGTRASGTVTLRNCSASTNSVTIPSGTGVSSGNLTFITQEGITLPASSFNGLQQCTTPTEDINVVAQEAGDKYNLSPRSYTVAGYNSVNATGTSMSGGTSRLVKVVSEQDIDAAKQKFLAKDQNVQGELTQRLQTEGLLGINDTFQAGDPAYTVTPKAGEEGAEVTVTQVVAYTMLGVKQSDLEAILKKSVLEKIDTNSESIRGYGFEKAIFRIMERLNNGDIKMSLDTSVITGPEVREDDVKADIAGKKKAPARDSLRNRSGVTDVQINLRPFYVGSVPKNKSKITVKIEQNDSGSRSLNP